MPLTNNEQRLLATLVDLSCGGFRTFDADKQSDTSTSIWDIKNGFEVCHDQEEVGFRITVVENGKFLIGHLSSNGDFDAEEAEEFIRIVFQKFRTNNYLLAIGAPWYKKQTVVNTHNGDTSLEKTMAVLTSNFELILTYITKLPGYPIVCTEAARYITKLLVRNGVDAKIVSGEYEGIYHLWTAVGDTIVDFTRAQFNPDYIVNNNFSTYREKLMNNHYLQDPYIVLPNSSSYSKYKVFKVYKIEE